MTQKPAEGHATESKLTPCPGGGVGLASAGCGPLMAVHVPLARVSIRLPNSLTATQEPTAPHDTDESSNLVPPGGAGGSVAVQAPLSSVSISPTLAPWLSSNSPTATQKPAEAQEIALRLPPLPPAGSGPTAAVHEPPLSVSISTPTFSLPPA